MGKEKGKMSGKELKEASFHIKGGDFSNAGVASSELRSVLVALDIDPDTIRRAAIAAFEAEMNVIIHAVAGMLSYNVSNGAIKIEITDMGEGIPDIEQAMREGFSTAPDWVREMGWGAGMGLPNIKKNSDAFKLDSVVGEGTTLEITINIPKGEGK